MLFGLVLGCCKKGGSLRSYFLLHNQISGKRNPEVGGRESRRGGKAGGVCQ